MIDEFAVFNYKYQFLPWKKQLERVEWQNGRRDLPFIWVHNVSDFMVVYDSLFLAEGGLARLDAMQRDTMEWWKAAKAHFKQLVEDATCPLIRGRS
jgi:hypothetical protein